MDQRRGHSFAWDLTQIPRLGNRARARLVLDLWDFGAEKGARSFGNYFVPSL